MSQDLTIPAIAGAVAAVSVPANTLLKMISDATGAAFAPYQTIRLAKADRQAELIRMGEEVPLTELELRAIKRLISEESKKQENIESIAVKSAKLVDERGNCRPEEMEPDWITDVFEKCRNVSDDQMQDVWARLIAGEAESPGTFSKRTATFLADLDKRDAESFSQLCRFCMNLGSFSEPDMTPLIFNLDDGIYRKHGITFDLLTHLESLNLIRFEPAMELHKQYTATVLAWEYHHDRLAIKFPRRNDSTDLDNKSQATYGHVMLTILGKEIFRLTDPQPVEGLINYVTMKLSFQSIGVEVLPKAGEKNSYASDRSSSGT